MKQIKTVIEQRPHYYRGQLLLEDDFLAEQSYHVSARHRHNRHVHDWGVVRGLTVTRHSDHALTINAGVAVDESGHEIFLDETQQVSLAEFGPNELLRINLRCEETMSAEGSAAAPQKRRDVYAVITIATLSEDSAGLTLARVQLDGQGRIGDQAIDYSHTRYARSVAPGSITSTELHDTLRKGWLRVPFRPLPLVNVPEGETLIPPAFRVGETEALTPAPEEANAEDTGAAGTMAIPIPPSVTHVTRLRIAGARNEGGILLRLTIGGWDVSKNEHCRKIIVDERISAESPFVPFMRTFDIDRNDSELDPEYHTLSLWMRGMRRTSISLVGIEFVY